MEFWSIAVPPYQACLWWTLDNPCNLDCEYCCAVRVDPKNPPIATERVLKVLSETGMTFRLHFSSIGEPFVTPDFVNALLTLSRHHFLSFNTNLVAKSVPDFIDRISPERVLDITASLHLKELEKRGLFERYVENFLAARAAGFPVTAQVVAHPSLVDDIDHYRVWFRRRGIDITFNHFIGEFQGQHYPQAYTDPQLTAFSDDIRVGPEWVSQYGNPCNAGYNIAVVRPDGSVYHCYDVNRCLGHIDEKIQFGRELRTCPSMRCSCALNHMDRRLFEFALSKDGPTTMSGRQNDTSPVAVSGMKV